MFEFKSKSHTLKYLKSKNFNVNNFVSIKKKFLEDNQCAEVILKKFKNKKIILRSSATDEDQVSSSSAGKYDSIVLKKDKLQKLKNID